MSSKINNKLKNLASRNGNKEVIEILLAYKADPNAEDNLGLNSLVTGGIAF